MGPLNIIKPKKQFIFFFFFLSHCTRFDEISSQALSLSIDPDEINEPRRSMVPKRSRAHLDLMRRGQLVSKDAYPKEKKIPAARMYNQHPLHTQHLCATRGHQTNRTLACSLPRCVGAKARRTGEAER